MLPRHRWIERAEEIRESNRVLRAKGIKQRSPEVITNVLPHNTEYLKTRIKSLIDNTKNTPDYKDSLIKNSLDQLAEMRKSL
jgi:hypothetical protein